MQQSLPGASTPECAPISVSSGDLDVVRDPDPINRTASERPSEPIRVRYQGQVSVLSLVMRDDGHSDRSGLAMTPGQGGMDLGEFGQDARPQRTRRVRKSRPRKVGGCGYLCL